MLKYTQFEHKHVVGTEAGILLYTFIQDLSVQHIVVWTVYHYNTALSNKFNSRTQLIASYLTQILRPQLNTTQPQNLLETREVCSLENVTLWSQLDVVLSQNRNVLYRLAGESAPCVAEMND